MNAPRLIVGLGNPGAEYEDTRHNAGFWLVDRLARDLKVSLAPQSKFLGLAARAGDTWLLQPTTFMNRSGHAVAALARFYKIEPEEVLVVHDELDLMVPSASSRAAATAATTASRTSRPSSAVPISGACAWGSATPAAST